MKYAIVGGDARSARLCELLSRDGNRVCAFALEKAEIAGDAVKTGCLQGCVYGADCVILPVPSENGGVLNAPLSESVLSMSEVIGALWQGQVLIGGHLSDTSCALAQRAGVHTEDMLAREEFLWANAALTAECAVAKLIQASDRALFERSALICGWGRIGRLTAARLDALGARVTVGARAREAVAQARACGYRAAEYARLESEMGAFDFIVNTVPARVLSDAMLCLIGEGAVLLELASPPGGFDRTLAKNIGLNVVYAPGLPGKLAAYSAAEAMRESVYAIMRQQEE